MTHGEVTVSNSAARLGWRETTITFSSKTSRKNRLVTFMRRKCRLHIQFLSLVLCVLFPL